MMIFTWILTIVCGLIAAFIIITSIYEKDIDAYGVIVVGINLMTVALGIYLILTH